MMLTSRASREKAVFPIIFAVVLVPTAVALLLSGASVLEVLAFTMTVTVLAAAAIKFAFWLAEWTDRGDTP